MDTEYLLILEATPESLPKGEVPKNVEILTNISIADATNIFAHSMFMVLPLRDSTVPCGHVTTVSAMHMGKAILSTKSSRLNDYLLEDKNAEFFSPQNSTQLSKKIERFFSEPSICQRLGKFASNFAKQNRTEDNTVAYFRNYHKTNDVLV